VNLVSTDPRQVQGRAVAPTTPPSVPLPRPSRNLHPFCLELPSNPWNEASIPLASLVGFTRDGWLNGVRSPPRTAVCIHPFSPAALPPTPRRAASRRILADYSPPERRANNNPAMTRASRPTISDLPLLRAFVAALSRKGRRMHDVSSGRTRVCRTVSFSLSYLLPREFQRRQALH